VTSFVPWLDSHLKLKEILCIKAERTVNKDNTVSYNGKVLQIERNSSRFSYAKTKVRVHEYANGELAVFYGHSCLGRYDERGEAWKKATSEKMAA
jgi:hypothetical protein